MRDDTKNACVADYIEPFSSDFEGGLRFLHLIGGGGVVENEDPGQINSLIIENSHVSYTTLVARSRLKSYRQRLKSF